ncbi:hypothetical protein G7017_14600 [Pseudomonas fulva]|uniref:hypothetical protein n=1 Tax=Pseudomonas TaxID=286 RepID=UPI0010683760|nr:MULTISPECIES: hypothetical protein [Pseudomonas]MBA1222115.1 hypothetical protein [Pseudomonas fulva]MBN4165308.1 hypothetical protein [Pseudomonas fulva]
MSTKRFHGEAAQLLERRDYFIPVVGNDLVPDGSIRALLAGPMVEDASKLLLPEGLKAQT